MRARVVGLSLVLAVVACGDDTSTPADASSSADVVSTQDASVVDARVDAPTGIGDAATGLCARPDAANAYAIDFATAAIENPLSAGGIWTNDTQGTGGNVAPGILTSMRVGLASDGKTRIAFDTHGGVDYDDSFAFVPGFPGDQFVEAVIYKEPGYNPNANGSNHELELILGCSSKAGSRIWNEILFNAGGGVDVVYLDGGASDFTVIGDVSRISAIPKDGDVVRATKIGNQIRLYLNGQLWAGYDGKDPQRVAQGSGIGIAGFIRPGATHDKYGFRCVTMGNL